MNSGDDEPEGAFDTELDAVVLKDILAVLDFKGVAELLFDIEDDLVFRGVVL